MNHPQVLRPRTEFLWLLWVVVTTVTLLVVLTGCKSEDTRPPDDTDVVRAPAATDPCRCRPRPTLESAR